MDFQLEMMENRLQKLERSNRTLKFACIIGLTCATAFVSLGAAEQATKRIIEANEFILRDSEGHVRATLVADSLGDARLVFVDGSRKIKGIFAADRLVFSDLGGNARVAIRPESDGGTLIINGPDGGGVELSRDSDEVGLYMTHGKGDSLSVSIKKNKDFGDVLQNGPAIQLFDEQGFRTTLGQGDVFGKRPPSVASLVMLTKDDHVIWSAP
jgi:hypothetical protein